MPLSELGWCQTGTLGQPDEEGRDTEYVCCDKGIFTCLFFSAFEKYPLAGTPDL